MVERVATGNTEAYAISFIRQFLKYGRDVTN